MTDQPYLDGILDRVTVIHLQPDDVLVFSNAADIMADPGNFDRLKGIFGERPLVVFDGPVDIEVLRDIDFGERNDRPEQGHIVNTPRFQAALEEFRQKYERGEIDELSTRHSLNT